MDGRSHNFVPVEDAAVNIRLGFSERKPEPFPHKFDQFHGADTGGTAEDWLNL